MSGRTFYQHARKRPFLYVIINYTFLKMALLETECQPHLLLLLWKSLCCRLIYCGVIFNQETG